METVLNAATVAALIARIHRLQADNNGRWGTMDAYQMLKHCRLTEEILLGRTSYKRLLVGRIVGGKILSHILKNEAPMYINQPALPDVRTFGAGDFEAERHQWISLLQEYPTLRDHRCMHPFFGKMNQEAIGRYVYKHTDHHLRQFGT